MRECTWSRSLHRAWKGGQGPRRVFQELDPRRGGKKTYICITVTESSGRGGRGKEGGETTGLPPAQTVFSHGHPVSSGNEKKKENLLARAQRL